MWTVCSLIFIFAFRWLFAKLNAKSPRSARNRALPLMSGCHLFSVWKEKRQSQKGRAWDTDGGAILSGPLPASVPREYTTLPETKHIPVLFATPLPKGSLCWLMNVLCFQSWKSWKKKQKSKRKTKSSLHLHNTIYFSFHLNTSCNSKKIKSYSFHSYSKNVKHSRNANVFLLTGAQRK